MTAHGSDNMAFDFSAFQNKILLLNIILRVNFTREAEIVTLTRNNCQLPSLFTDFKIWYKNTKIVNFYFTDSLVWYMLMFHLGAGEKPSIFTSPYWAR